MKHIIFKVATISYLAGIFVGIIWIINDRPVNIYRIVAEHHFEENYQAIFDLELTTDQLTILSEIFRFGFATTQKMIDGLKEYYGTPGKKLELAAMINSEQWLVKFLDIDPTYAMSARFEAAKHGHINILKILFQGKYIVNYNPRFCKNYILSTSILARRFDVLEYLLEIGADDYDTIMRSSAYIGNLDLVKMAVDKGATLFSEALTQALFADRTEIIKFFASIMNKQDFRAVIVNHPFYNQKTLKFQSYFNI